MRLPRKMQRHLTLIILSSVFFFTGCGLLWQSEDMPPVEKAKEGQSDESHANATEVSIKPLRLPDGKELSDIEVILEAPSDPVDGFIIKYGSAPEALNQTKRVELSELQKVSAPVGSTARYRFLIRAIPNNQPVFLTVTSFRGDSMSAESGVIEAK